MTKWKCDKKGCGCAPCRCEMQGSFEPVYCILKDDKTYPKWEMYDTETKYEHVERRLVLDALKNIGEKATVA